MAGETIESMFGKEKIDTKRLKAYCWEMQKIVNPYQARMAFFSDENVHEEFNFYCPYCGIPLESKNVIRRRNLDLKKDNSPHFSKWRGDHIKHKSKYCLHKNTSISGGKTRGPKASREEEDFYFKKFLTTPMETGLVKLTKNAPKEVPFSILEMAEEFSGTHDEHTTSIFQDIVQCYVKLDALNKTEEYELKIDDSYKNGTYNSIFKSFNKYGAYFTYKNSNIVKYSIYHASISNKYLHEDDYSDYWNFRINFNLDKASCVFDGQRIDIFFEVLLPKQLLEQNLQIKNYLIKMSQEKKPLAKCFIANTMPDEPVFVLNKDSSSKGHYLSKIKIENLNHIVLTFKE